MRLTSDLDTGEVTVTLTAPDAGGFRPTVVMGRIFRAIADDPGVTKSTLRHSVPGKNATKDLALQLLISEKYVGVKRDGTAHRHHVLRPFDPDSAPVPPPCPDRAPAGPEPTVPPCPAPIGGKGNGGRQQEELEPSDPAPLRRAQ